MLGSQSISLWQILILMIYPSYWVAVNIKFVLLLTRILYMPYCKMLYQDPNIFFFDFRKLSILVGVFLYVDVHVWFNRPSNAK